MTLQPGSCRTLVRQRVVWLSISVMCLCLQPSVADQSIENFTLASHRGVEWSLSDVSDRQLVVVAFLGTECPLAKLYGPRLDAL